MERADQLAAAVRSVHEDGFAILSGWLPAEQIVGALEDLGAVYPSRSEFHSDPQSPGNVAFVGDQFAGQREIPFDSAELSLLTVNETLVDLAAVVLNDTDLRLYAGEMWAKYTGAAEYAQEHHRDNHSLLVPSDDESCKQIELFVLLSDVEEVDGPPAFVPRRFTTGLPNERHAFGRDEHPEVYEHPPFLRTPELRWLASERSPYACCASAGVS